MHDSEQQKRDRERLTASIALDAQRRQPGPAAPEPAQWQAFLDGKLDAAESAAMLDYVDADPDAYRQWVRCAAQTQKAGSGARLRAWFAAWRRPWLVPAAVGAAVAVLAALVLVDPTPDGLDAGYAQVAALVRQADRPAQRKDFRAPGSGAAESFGFSAAAPTGPAWTAFVDGLGAGRRQLEAQLGVAAEASGTPHAAAPRDRWYRLGRWYYLLWFVTRTELAPGHAFWLEQTALLADLQTAIGDDSTPRSEAVAPHLQAIGGSLDALGRAPDDRRVRHRLQSQLKSLWENLAAAP